jgi:hypothetical protein
MAFGDEAAYAPVREQESGGEPVQTSSDDEYVGFDDHRRSHSHETSSPRWISAVVRTRRTSEKAEATWTVRGAPGSVSIMEASRR